MRVNKAIVILLTAILVGWGLGASKDNVKVGVVDIEQAATSTEEGKNARDEMDRKQREAQAKLQPLVERYQELVKELDAKQFILSEDALFQKQMDVAELRNEIETKQKQEQGQLEVDRERLIAPLRTKLVEVVEEVGREEGFSMIFSRGTPGLLYSREALDVTDLVIEKFNKKG